MIKVVVYDCDGVIVDSSNSILAYYDWMMKKCNLPPIDWSEEELKEKALSMADRDILEVLSKGDKLLYEKMLNISRDDEINNSFSNMVLQDGIEEGLKIIKNSNLPISIFTNRGKSLPLLIKYFNIEKYFSMLVTSNDVSEPKPSPEGLIKISDYFNVKTDEILFIGDSPTDYYAAKRCGANFIAFKKALYDSVVIENHRDIEKFI